MFLCYFDSFALDSSLSGQYVQEIHLSKVMQSLHEIFIQFEVNVETMFRGIRLYYTGLVSSKRVDGIA